MPSKKLGKAIRAALKANPGKVVLVRTRRTADAVISRYEDGVFYGDCTGKDTWGTDGHYFHWEAPGRYAKANFDLMEVLGVQDATD